MNKNHKGPQSFEVCWGKVLSIEALDDNMKNIHKYGADMELRYAFSEPMVDQFLCIQRASLTEKTRIHGN